MELDEVPASAEVACVKGSHKWRMRHPVTNFSGSDTSEKNVHDDSDAGLIKIPDIEEMVEKGDCEVLKWDIQPGGKSFAC